MRLLSSDSPRPAPRVHGAFATVVRGPTLADFSVNVNPFGPTARVVEAARAALLAPYPDSSAAAVRAAIGARYRRRASEVVFGNGASDLLWTFARALLGPSRRAVVLAPAFGEIVAAIEASGAATTLLEAREETGFEPPLGELRSLLASTNVDAVFLSDPTTPAGRPLDTGVLTALAREHEAVCFLLDESFVALSAHAHRLDEALPPNVVRLRSLTKEHSIAGVRAGYLLAPTALAARLEAERPAWSTSTIAQAVALAALEDDAFVEASRARLAEQRTALERMLRGLALEPVPSVAPYLIVRVPNATELQEGLAERGILVRDCTSFGLPRHVRLAARPAADVALLEAALRTLLR